MIIQYFIIGHEHGRPDRKLIINLCANREEYGRNKLPNCLIEYKERKNINNIGERATVGCWVIILRDLEGSSTVWSEVAVVALVVTVTTTETTTTKEVSIPRWTQNRIDSKWRLSYTARLCPFFNPLLELLMQPRTEAENKKFISGLPGTTRPVILSDGQGSDN